MARSSGQAAFQGLRPKGRWGKMLAVSLKWRLGVVKRRPKGTEWEVVWGGLLPARGWVAGPGCGQGRSLRGLGDLPRLPSLPCLPLLRCTPVPSGALWVSLWLRVSF